MELLKRQGIHTYPITYMSLGDYTLGKTYGDHVFFAKNQLFQCRTKQPFRVARGKSKWIWYNLNKSHIDWNLREVLNDEIVIEFDMPKNYEGDIQHFRDNISYPAINFTAINLLRNGFSFEVWDHQGKSPHIHIRNLPISQFEKDKLRQFKKFFVRKYCAEEFLDYVDFSLCGIHLVALEGTYHWKGSYGIKRLLGVFKPDGTPGK